MKKTTTILFLFILSMISCECFKSTQWKMTGFSIDVQNTQAQSIVNNEIAGDSLNLICFFAADFAENVPVQTSFLIPTLMATSCTSSGDGGMFDPVVDVQITTDSTFNDIDSGGSINEIILVNGNKTIPEWLMTTENLSFEFHNRTDFLITQKPESSQNYSFKIRMELESGLVFSDSTQVFIWR